MPSVNCLIAISDFPPFVLTVKEIEICHFERVSYQLKNFDMAVIFKDYRKPVLIISAIPISYLERIKNWLN